MTALSKTSQLAITALVRSRETRDAVLAALEPERHLSCDVRIQPLGPDATILPDAPPADLLLIEVDLEDSAELSALEALAATRGAAPIITLTHESAGTDAGETSLAGMRRLMRLGVADVVLLPLRRGDLLAAVAGVQRSGSQAAPPPAGGTAGSGPGADGEGRVISVLKACGGSGATTVAVHVASALSRMARRKDGPALPRGVGLIDLDLQFGSTGLYLDLTPRLSAYDLLQTPERLDPELLSSAATRHKSGLAVLPAPPDVVPLDTLAPATAARLLAVARRTWAHTVIELPHAWTAWTRATLAASDAVLLVTQMTVPGIHHTRRQIDTLCQEGLGDVPVLVVVNRYDRGLFRDSVIKDAERALERPLEHFIPSDFKAISQAIDAGASLQETRQGRRPLKRLEALAKAVAEAATAPRPVHGG